MKNAVIVDSVRTAIGRLGGSLKDVQVDFLAAKVLDEITVRTGIEKSVVDEVILGQGNKVLTLPISLDSRCYGLDFRLKYQATRFTVNVDQVFKLLTMPFNKSNVVYRML